MERIFKYCLVLFATILIGNAAKAQDIKSKDGKILIHQVSDVLFKCPMYDFEYRFDDSKGEVWRKENAFNRESVVMKYKKEGNKLNFYNMTNELVGSVDESNRILGYKDDIRATVDNAGKADIYSGEYAGYPVSGINAERLAFFILSIN